MALVSTGFEASVELRDSSNRPFRKIYEFDPAVVTTNAEALTATAAAVAALNPITDGAIKSYRVTEVFEENAFALPTGGVNGSEQAMLVWNIEGQLKTVNHFIPAPSPGIFVSTSGPNRDVVDITDADLGTYQNLFKTTGGDLLVSDGEHIDDAVPLIRGERVTKKYNPR